MPELIKLEPDGHGWRVDATWANCDGMWFLCPKCFIAHGRSAIGTHHFVCWKPHVAESVSPSPGRWNLVGKGLHDVSLVNGSSSVQLLGGCRAHFHIRNGRVEDLT